MEAERGRTRATPPAARRWRPPAGSVAWNAVSKQATAGTSGEPPRDGVDGGERARLVQRRRASVSSMQAARTSSSIQVGRPQRVAAVHDAMRRRRRAPAARRARRRGTASPRGHSAVALGDVRSSASSSRSFRLLEPALTTSTRSRVSPARSSRGRPGGSSPCSRVYARWRRRSSTMCWRSAGGARREAGHAVDDVDDEVEAVEVVEHDHVERRGRRALLLVAAHVEVRGGWCRR